MMMKRKTTILLTLLFIASVQLFAQQSIKGKVTSSEDGEPLPGATIQIEGTTKGVTTDLDGNYSIDVPSKESVLVYSYVGYLDETLTVGEQSVIDVSLSPDIQDIDEIIVIGYGIEKKSLVTGAISKIKSEDIVQSRSTRVESALQGKTAGVLVQQSSGAPGAEQNVIIRGIGSNNAVRPIYVIDGIRTDGIDWLDPEDIASIEILKDAASAAIYGTEAANGVVLITTKTGKSGATQFSYDGSYGIQRLNTNFEVFDTENYLGYYRKAFMNDNGASLERAIEEYPDNDINTDWMDEIFMTAPTQKHKLSVSGGNENTSYYISSSYTNQSGIIGGGGVSLFERYATKLNLDTKATNWLKMGTRIAYTHSDKRGIDENSVFGSVTNNAMILDPTTPVRYTSDTNDISIVDRRQMRDSWGEDWYMQPGIQDEDGHYWGISQTVKNEIQNPVAQLDNDNDKTVINKLIGGIYGDIRFFEGLNFRTTFDIDLSHNYIRGWSPLEYYNSVMGPDEKSTSNQRIEMYFTWQWESYLSFDKTFDDLSVGAVLGASAREYTYEFMEVTGKDLIKQSDNYAWANAGTFIDTLNNNGFGNLDGWERLASYFGRVKLSWQDKYMVTSNFRSDGSSKFGPDKKIGFFPSFSTGWVLSREDFFTIPMISYAKVRYSWGKNGSATSLGWDWQYLPIGSTGDYYYPSGTGQYLDVNEPVRLTNPEYAWEESKQNDIGIDLGFFRNRITFTFDWYKKETIGLLMSGNAALFVGNDPPIKNAGTVENTGIELELGFNGGIGELSYDLMATATYNKNEVTALPEGIDFLTGGNIGTFGSSKRFEEGYPAWYFYGYQSDGLFTSEEEIQAHVNEEGDLLQRNAQVGDVKYLDIAGPADSLGNTPPDGRINENDRTDLGTPYPDWIGGLNINLSYKGFDFNMYTYASIGNKVLLAVSVRDDLTLPNKPQYWLDDAYDPETGTGSFPRATENDRNRNFSRINEFMLQDGSFVRISNVTLGYTIPASLSEKIGLQKLRVYLAIDNLKTFTKYKGIEPEVGGNYWENNGQEWAGIDRSVYPRPQTILAGINVNF